MRTLLLGGGDELSVQDSASTRVRARGTRLRARVDRQQLHREAVPGCSSGTREVSLSGLVWRPTVGKPQAHRARLGEDDVDMPLGRAVELHRRAQWASVRLSTDAPHIMNMVRRRGHAGAAAGRAQISQRSQHDSATVRERHHPRCGVLSSAIVGRGGAERIP